MALALLLSRWHPLTPPSERCKTSRWAQASLRAQLILLAIVIGHPFSARSSSGRLRVDFLDVGQGDSALITTPDGTTVLVDGGGRQSFFSRRDASATGDNETFARDTRGIGEAVVSEYLWWRGLDSVDYIIATHADADHIDGLNEVARNFAFAWRSRGSRPTQRSGICEVL